MIAWFKTLARIVRTYDAQRRQTYVDCLALCDAHKTRILELEKRLAEQTTLAVDVNMREPNYVIAIGRFKGADYIQTFTLADGRDFSGLIGELKVMQHRGAIRFIDAPPEMRAVIRRKTL